MNNFAKKTKVDNLKQDAVDDRVSILFIIPGAGQGGAEVQLLELAKGISKKRFKVYLGFLYNSGVMKEQFDELTSKGIELVNFQKKSAKDMKVYFRISKFLKDKKIDIVQAFITNHSAYMPVLLGGKSIAIGGIRDSFSHEKSFSDRLVHFHIPRNITRLGKYAMISNSETAKKLYASKGVDENKILVIPNGIDIERASSGKKNRAISSLGLKGKKVITMVGRLIDTKNHLKLIESLKQLFSEDKNLVLLIAGDGPMRHKIDAKINELGLIGRVLMLGNRKDVPDLLAASNVFVFPSESEAWPNVLGEAMAASLPVVSFNAGDVASIIDDGKDGYIVSNMQALVDRTRWLLNNPAKARSIGKKAKAKISKKFSTKKMIVTYEKAYEKILARLGRPK